METTQWTKDPRSANRKGDNIFEARFSRGRIVRYDTPPALSYGFFLEERDWLRIKQTLDAGSWTFYEGSTLHFYGGGYLYAEGNGAVSKILALLDLKIVWI